MKAWFRSATLALSAATAMLAGGSNAVQAQPRGSQCTGAPLLMVVWFKGPDRATALRAREQVYQQIRSVSDSKELCVLPVSADGPMDIMLKNSGYPTDRLLTAAEALQLARPLSVEEILQGEVEVVGTNVVMSGTYYLARDDKGNLREKIAKTAPGSVSQAAKALAQRIEQIRKELPAEKRCYAARRSDKLAEAVTAANQAIAAYPEGILGRMCLASAMQQQKKSPDEILAVVKEIQQRDPNNFRAMQMAAEEYYNKGDRKEFARVAGELIAADPTNSDAVENYVAHLAEWKLTEDALRALDTVLKADPDNNNLRRIEFRLIYSAERYKAAAARGEELARIDTAAVDTLFMQRMISAYAKDSQPDRVLAWLQRGVQRFPNVVSFTIGLAQTYTARNQPLDAVATYKRLILIAPKEPDIRLRIANTYHEVGQTDSALVWLREASRNGEDSSKVAAVASQIANKFVNVARESKQVDDYKKAIPFIAFADSTYAGDGLAKFLWAVTAYSIAGAIVSNLEQNGTCEQAKEAKQWAELVSPKIMGGGGRYNAENAAKIMNGLNGDNGLITYLDRWMAARRCTSR